MLKIKYCRLYRKCFMGFKLYLNLEFFCPYASTFHRKHFQSLAMLLRPSVGSSLYSKIIRALSLRHFDTPCPGGLGLHSDLTSCLSKQMFQGTTKLCINIQGIHTTDAKCQANPLGVTFQVTQSLEVRKEASSKKSTGSIERLSALILYAA